MVIGSRVTYLFTRRLLPLGETWSALFLDGSDVSLRVCVQCCRRKRHNGALVGQKIVLIFLSNSFVEINCKMKTGKLLVEQLTLQCP